jgi:hypothetical protein
MFLCCGDETAHIIVKLVYRIEKCELRKITASVSCSLESTRSFAAKTFCFSVVKYHGVLIEHVILEIFVDLNRCAMSNYTLINVKFSDLFLCILH